MKLLASAFEFSVANFKLVGELLTLIAFVLQAVDELRHETANLSTSCWMVGMRYSAEDGDGSVEVLGLLPEYRS